MKKRTKKEPKKKGSVMKVIFHWLLDILIITAGSGAYALGVHCFTAPNNIAPGGVTGIATLINHFIDVPIGTIYFVFNIPLIILGFIFLNKKLMVKTLISIAIVTVMMDFAFVNIPVYHGEGILASVFGGLLMGIGLGVVYTRESTTGGLDIVNKIINRFMPQLKLGQITLITDGMVLIAALAVFREADVILYAIIAIFVQSKVMDMIVYGSFEGKMMWVFSDKYDEIARKIMTTQRGVTIFKGSGAYSGHEKNVICTAVHKNEYTKIKRYIKEIDPTAFVVITDANEVLGQGFSKLDVN